MFDTLLLVIVVTPGGLTRENKVSSVVLQTTSGQIEVLRGHVPMVTVLEPGEMCLRDPSGEEFFALGEGFAEVTSDRVTIFSDLAEKADAIMLEATETAMQRATLNLAESASLSPDERESVELQVRECQVKIEIGLRRKKQGVRPGPAH